MKKSVLKKYAKLLIRRGVNIQKGQTLIIYAGFDQPEFVQMVVEEAYKAKAKKVILKWYHQPLSKLSNKYQTVETLGTVSPDELAFYQWRTEEIPARLFIDSDDPDGSKGVDQQKASK